MHTITICGSMKFAKEMKNWKIKLENEGFKIYVPGGIVDLENYKEAGSHDAAVKRKIDDDFINHHYKYIKQSEGILVLNYDKNNIENYIGGNSFLEMGFAFTLNRDIFLLNPIPDIQYKSELCAMSPIVIQTKKEMINAYYANLPKVYLSSTNILKINATTLGFREFNQRVSVEGKTTLSKVSEQPSSFEEAYEGAINRLTDLKKQIDHNDFEYLVSLESGIAKLHKKHNLFGFSVCVIENKKGKRATVIDTDLEIPKEMTDLVPKPYADLGILVQEKYGIENKDPYLHFTKHKISRERFLQNSIINAIASL